MIYEKFFVVVVVAIPKTVNKSTNEFHILFPQFLHVTHLVEQHFCSCKVFLTFLSWNFKCSSTSLQAMSCVCYLKIFLFWLYTSEEYSKCFAQTHYTSTLANNPCCTEKQGDNTFMCRYFPMQSVSMSQWPKQENVLTPCLLNSVKNTCISVFTKDMFLRWTQMSWTLVKHMHVPF